MGDSVPLPPTGGKDRKVRGVQYQMVNAKQLYGTRRLLRTAKADRTSSRWHKMKGDLPIHLLRVTHYENHSLRVLFKLIKITTTEARRIYFTLSEAAFEEVFTRAAAVILYVLCTSVCNFSPSSNQVEEGSHRVTMLTM